MAEKTQKRDNSDFARFRKCRWSNGWLVGWLVGLCTKCKLEAHHRLVQTAHVHHRLVQITHVHQRLVQYHEGTLVHHRLAHKELY